MSNDLIFLVMNELHPVININTIFFLGIFILKRNHLNVPNVGRASVNRGPWLSTRSCIWRKARTSVQSASEASTSGATWRLTYWRTRTTSPTSATSAIKCSGATVTCAGTSWPTPSVKIQEIFPSEVEWCLVVVAAVRPPRLEKHLMSLMGLRIENPIQILMWMWQVHF